MIRMQLMEVTAPSNTPGTGVGGLSPTVIDGGLQATWSDRECV
jgi:hypothetical protein